MRLQATLTESEADVVKTEWPVDSTSTFSEVLRHKVHVQPGGIPKDIGTMLAEIGVASVIKAIWVTSSHDGVVANITTDAEAVKPAGIGCYPLLFFGVEGGFSVDSPFEMTIELPAGGETAIVEIVAYA